MRIRTFRRHSVMAVALAGLVLTAAGCNADSNAEPEPLPSSSSTSPSGPTTTSPTPTPTGWESEFTEEQLQAYQEALQRFESYEQRSEPIWAAGKATPAAERLFKEYFPSPQWQTQYNQLKTYEQVEVKILHSPAVFWTKAAHVSMSNNGNDASVTIKQCVDLTAQATTQYGEPVEFSEPLRKPVVRTIRLYIVEGYAWLILDNQLPTSDDYQRCRQDVVS